LHAQGDIPLLSLASLHYYTTLAAFIQLNFVRLTHRSPYRL
jgi:hypothetical protein